MARPREFDVEEALDAATAVFWEKGYEATSMADLMDATGLHKGSIYKAFQDKHDLFVQALSRYLESAYAMLHEALATAKTPMAGLKSVMDLTCLCSRNESRRGCFAVNSAVELSHDDEQIADVMKKHFSRLDRLFVTHIERGQALGEFRDDFSAEQLAEGFSVYLSGVMARARCSYPRKHRERLARFGLRMLEKPA